MDNLVDIDALLGDLELESETSNGHVPVANLPLSQPAATNGHNLTLPSAVTSNGFTNSTNGANKSASFMDDLLDLSLEPTFEPNLSSLQMNPNPSMKTQSSLGTGYLSQTSTQPKPSVVQPNFADEFFIMPSATVSPNVQPDILTDSFNSSTNQRNLSIGIGPQKSYMPDIMTSSNNSETFGGYGMTANTRNDQMLNFNQQAFPASNQQNTAANILAGNPVNDSESSATNSNILPDLTFIDMGINTRSEVTSGSQHTVQQQHHPQNTKYNAGFLPLTEDLEFLNSYEAQRNGQTIHSGSRMQPNISPTKSSFHSTSDKAEPTAPSLGQFSSEFSVPNSVPLSSPLNGTESLTGPLSNQVKTSSNPPSFSRSLKPESASNSLLVSNSPSLQPSNHSSLTHAMVDSPSLNDNSSHQSETGITLPAKSLLPASELSHHSNDVIHSNDFHLAFESGPQSSLSNSPYSNGLEPVGNPYPHGYGNTAGSLFLQATGQEAPASNYSLPSSDLTDPTRITSNGIQADQLSGLSGPSSYTQPETYRSPINSLNYSIPSGNSVGSTPPLSLTANLKQTTEDQTRMLTSDSVSLGNNSLSSLSQLGPDVILGGSTHYEQPMTDETLLVAQAPSHQTVMLEGDQMAELRLASSAPAQIEDEAIDEPSDVMVAHVPTAALNPLLAGQSIKPAVTEDPYVKKAIHPDGSAFIHGLDQLLPQQPQHHDDHERCIGDKGISMYSDATLVDDHSAVQPPSYLDGNLDFSPSLEQTSTHHKLIEGQNSHSHSPDLSLPNDEEEFNSLLAANGYNLSSTDKVSATFTPRATGTEFMEPPLGNEINQLISPVNNAYSSPTGSVSSLQRLSSRIRTNSVDSFSRMSHLDAQISVESFTALHNLAQAPRNSLLEDNGITSSNDEDMGWDIGATPTNVAETSHNIAAEPIPQMNCHGASSSFLTEFAIPQSDGFTPDHDDVVDRPLPSSRQPITEDDYHNIWDTQNHPSAQDNQLSFGTAPAIDNSFYPTSADDILNDIGISMSYSPDELPPGSVPQSEGPAGLALLGEGFLAEDASVQNFVSGVPEDIYSSHLPIAPVGSGTPFMDPPVPTPTTADLQSMVVQDDPPAEEDDPNHGDESMASNPPPDDHPGESPPPYQLIDPSLDQNRAISEPPYTEVPDQQQDEPPLPSSDAGIEYMDLGATQPFWIPDSDSSVCMLCEAKFTMTKRRHHCRACGKLFCSSCCSMKSKLQYMDFKEAKVCKTCHEQIALAAEQQARMFSGQAMPQEGHTQASPTQESLAGAVSGAEASQRPAGVLKDTSRGSISNRDSNRSVIFSDGIRPGDENSHLDGSDTTPSSRVRRKNKNRQKTSQRLRETLRNTFLIPEDSLPPLLCYDNDSSQYSAVDTEPDEAGLIAKLRDEGDDGRFAFAIHKDLNVGIKIVNMDCCTGSICWCFTSNGLNTVSQDEIVFVLRCEADENRIPRDVFHLFKMLYQHAAAGQQVNELGYVDLSRVQPFNETGFMGNTDLTALMFIRSTFQCSKGLNLPSPPFLYAILIHRLELPWAILFPLRLKLRLGAEFKHYPCPLMSVRNRQSVYRENTNTIMNLLADFQGYQYSLTKIEGFTVHLTDKVTTISIPKNMYSTVMKVVGSSQECVISFGASFSNQADSHIVCIQNEDGRYSSSTMNISNQARSVTGASFVVFSGSMKESGNVSAKCSIVEDGIMVQITKEALDEFKAKLTNMQEYTVTCGRSSDGQDAAAEEVKIVWVDDYKDYNIGVNSPIDDFPMDGVMSLRVKSFNDLTHDTYTIRWTEVFFVQVDETRLTIDAMEITQFSETIANSSCVALAPYLQKLHDHDMKKVALRVTLGPEQVEYICGASGQRLASDIMNSLDSELIPVLHSAVSLTSGTLLVLELIFHILE